MRVVVLAYTGTVEPPAWDLIAHKIAWAQAVYGDSAPGGLGQFEDAGLDLLEALAKQLEAGSGMPGGGALLGFEPEPTAPGTAGPPSPQAAPDAPAAGPPPEPAPPAGGSVGVQLRLPI